MNKLSLLICFFLPLNIGAYIPIDIKISSTESQKLKLYFWQPQNAQECIKPTSKDGVEDMIVETNIGDTTATWKVNEITARMLDCPANAYLQKIEREDGTVLMDDFYVLHNNVHIDIKKTEAIILSWK